MNSSKAIMAAVAIAGTMLAGCADSPKEEPTAIIGKQEIKIENGTFSPEALWAMGRIGSVTPSPDGSRILYSTSYYSVAQDKSHHTLNIMDADGSNKQSLTTTAANETSAAWIKNGSKIAFPNSIQFGQ